MASLSDRGFIPQLSPYHYLPSKAAGFAIIVLFVLSTLAHAGVALYRRLWWILPTIVLCGILEILGWAARLWSSYEPYEITPFTVQITATVLGPTPFLAAVFIMFGEVIKQLGSAYSRLTPKYYAIIFCSCDVVSLLIQGAGGGIASSAANGNRDPTVGGNIMLAGIIFQLLVIFVFVLCCIEYFVRYFSSRPLRVYDHGSTMDTQRNEFTTDLKIMVSGLAFTTLVLFIRAIYRTIELADGWTGRIIRTEIYFIVLDAIMIVVGMYTMNIVHPGRFLYSPSTAPKQSGSSETVADNFQMNLIK
ncbi:RTA1-like protein [Coprinellus micaceus]|uniref:RTA1-like protein n=1 Tax=Coprinellus micaceus TaxID=71717 RepID=A0A4Y7SMW9_COPMI|nr:RTA1-like protein [Coprinellus micaceus]TEB24032.1 RTA1-like protein [Coprinellus micaceus]